MMQEEIRQIDLNINVSEEELIAAAKPFFKERGFKKKNKRWTKITDEFELTFLIHSYQIKGLYNVSVGVNLNKFDKGIIKDCSHFDSSIPITTIDEILNSADKFFNEWTNHALIKERALSFIEWDKRNPLEKRRALAVDYENDPCPTDVLYHVLYMHKDILNYIIENF